MASILSQTPRDADVSQVALAEIMSWHRSKAVKIEAAKISIRAAALILVAQAPQDRSATALGPGAEVELFYSLRILASGGLNLATDGVYTIYY